MHTLHCGHIPWQNCSSLLQIAASKCTQLQVIGLIKKGEHIQITREMGNAFEYRTSLSSHLKSFVLRIRLTAKTSLKNNPNLTYLFGSKSLKQKTCLIEFMHNTALVFFCAKLGSLKTTAYEMHHRNALVLVHVLNITLGATRECLMFSYTVLRDTALYI